MLNIGHANLCFLPFQYNDVDEFVLGEPFFRAFYTVFDDTKGVVGFGPSVNFTLSKIY